ncbi:MAG: efflux RND transporter periplasmic adaptor subunit [Salegentibacter sp.]|uniref:HlyD family secretion protein n=1 Tax=Salegentibacter flavus TaxID=287099 RepID=A0A1I5D671_9FLAO|nr:MULTISPECIES: efflux RND transporter periplasmic adaptor subunit [Salegentibacter]MDR9457618.1 efflux RND transporter periplasmic adaptor subunit [Salegentibacter sp.]SFN94725.1 HlyD family secretion protein [Salegentibacter flavus]
MMKKGILILVSFTIAGLVSCSDENKADGYGNFEATEIIVSAEAQGKIKYFNVREGDEIESGIQVALIDTTQLHWEKQQLLASKKTVASKSQGVFSQIDVLNEKLKIAEQEEKRVRNLFAENAATQRQVDQTEGEVQVIKEEIKNVKTRNAPIVNEIQLIDAQIGKINDLIEKSIIENPLKGTVLAGYAEPGEITGFGKPLYKIADLEFLTLRVYISETQLSDIELGQEVTVKVDSRKENMKSYPGKITWISSSAEFTPKTIQTREERANLVYAVDVKVKNDGSLKIGMPAEMWVSTEE